MSNTFTFTDEQLLCLQVCLQNAPTPYHISKKKIVSALEDKIGKPIKPKVEPLKLHQITMAAMHQSYDAIVVSDYNKGYITEKKLFELVDWFDGPVFIDSKKTLLPEDAYIKINELEYERMSHSNYENLIVTKGGKGAEYQGKLYPAEKVNVFDVVGAGDTFLAALTYGYLKYGRIDRAIPLANKAAAVAVSHRGTYVLTEEDVKKILC